ncbi:hypothetical protein GWO43_20305 [candidate division KSB1 bacterium]|nr:hypothetical protein [candidate division KSB1 bacterium]NIX72857.1 hypothetical protein [candidate division KSB1 bacterium]
MLLKDSKADETFKDAVRRFADGEKSELIKHAPGAPPVKIMRVLMKLLEEYPGEPITNVTIDGQSTCSAYHGTLTFGPKQTKIRFNWDCSWKAREAGFTTWYGAPDQTKAAQQYGYQCFETFEEVN